MPDAPAKPNAVVHPCRACAAGIRRLRIRLHSQVQRQVYGRMVRIDRWYHDCLSCGGAALLCTVCHWPVGQDAPDPDPPHDLHDWPTEVFAAVVVAPEEVPVPDPEQLDPYLTPWPPVDASTSTMKSGQRDPEFRFGGLTKADREVLAAERPAPELVARFLNALTRWTPTPAAPGNGVRP